MSTSSCNSSCDNPDDGSRFLEMSMLASAPGSEATHICGDIRWHSFNIATKSSHLVGSEEFGKTPRSESSVT
jgi:hypothetical protein